MLTQDQRNRLKQSGYTDVQIKVFESSREVNQDGQEQESQQKPRFGQRTKEAFQSGVGKIKDVYNKPANNPLEFMENVGKLGAGAVEAAFSPLTAAAQPVVEPTLERGIKFAADKISDIPAVQRFADSNAGRVTERVTQNIANYNTIAGTVGGFKGLTRVPGATSKITSNITSKADDIVDQALKPVRQTSLNVADKVKSSSIVQEAQRIPSRFKTNLAQRQNVQKTINQLPTKVAKEAAQDGLDIADIKTLYKIPASQKAPLRNLAVTVKKFAEGNTRTNPIEVVGRPIVNRLKELERARVRVGSKLGNLADDLGVVTKEELLPPVFQRLRKVPGLEGLSLDDAGNLSFKNTVLATAETAADRKAIQGIFNSATKWGQGKNKHLLRQELFESLGGKKAASLKLTATQERAYEAIRQGLSDVLESKNAGYKSLSNQYRQIMNPLKEMRKLMKVAGEADDILDMSAGLLARRITSAAPSNPQIKAILSAMDRATKKTSLTRARVEVLQDFYNILEKYYDIAPRTGFQAQIRQGVEKAVGGPINYIADQVKGFAGETPAVRQRALENILEEVLR